MGRDQRSNLRMRQQLSLMQPLFKAIISKVGAVDLSPEDIEASTYDVRRVMMIPQPDGNVLLDFEVEEVEW